MTEKAEIIVTDPPYNVKIKGHVCSNGKIQHTNFKMASGEMTESEFMDFTQKFMENLRESSTDGSLHYIFIDLRGSKTFLTAGEQYDELKNNIVQTAKCIFYIIAKTICIFVKQINLY